MSIVVFFIAPEGATRSQAFGKSDLSAALAFSKARRDEGCRHVCISSELEESVGKPGVDQVEGGRLPDGYPYDFDKRHRGAGPRED